VNKETNNGTLTANFINESMENQLKA